MRSTLAGTFTARRTVSRMTGSSEPGEVAAHDDAHPTMAQEAGSIISAAVLHLARMTGAQTVHRPPSPCASFTEERAEPGGGIRAAVTLVRAAH